MLLVSLTLSHFGQRYHIKEVFKVMKFYTGDLELHIGFFFRWVTFNKSRPTRGVAVKTIRVEVNGIVFLIARVI